MEFGENHKAKLDTIRDAEASLYLDFLEHEQARHLHEMENAEAMRLEYEVSGRLWESAVKRHSEARADCLQLIIEVRRRWQLPSV